MAKATKKTAPKKTTTKKTTSKKTTTKKTAPKKTATKKTTPKKTATKKTAPKKTTTKEITAKTAGTPSVAKFRENTPGGYIKSLLIAGGLTDAAIWAKVKEKFPAFDTSENNARIGYVSWCRTYLNQKNGLTIVRVTSKK